MTQLFTNNANTTLSSALTAAATSLVVQPGAGTKFPSPAAGDSFLVTLFKVANGVESNYEIVKVTARASDTFTIVRAQEGTTAQAYGVGDQVSMRNTAGTLAGLAQLGAPAAFTVSVTVPTMAATDNSTNAANTAYVTTAINNLIAAAPGTLNTLKELADAIGDDPNYATTTATALGNRLRVDVNTQGLSGTQQANGRTNLGLATVAATGSYADLTNKPSIAAPGANADITSLTVVTNLRNGTAAGSGINIDGSGNVGVGTSTPGNALEVSGAGPFAIIRGTTNANWRGLSFRTGASDATDYAKVQFQGTSGELQITAGIAAWGGYQTFYTNGLERMRLDTSGNLGIGITAPESPLHVSGEIRNGAAGANLGVIIPSALAAIPSSSVKAVMGSVNSTVGFGLPAGSLAYQPRTGVNATHSFFTEGAERMRIDATGKVGINVAGAADQKLTIGSGSDTTNQGDGISFYGSSTNKQAAILSYNTGSFNGDLRFYTKTSASASTTVTEAMRIDPNGNLGLGTAPKGGTTGFSIFELSASSYMTQASTGSIYLGKNWYYNNGNYRNKIANEFSTMYCQDTGNHRWLSVAAQAAADTAITFVEQMRLNSSGNLLLGSTTDDSVGKLQVNGNVSLTGTLVAKGTSLFGGATGAYTGYASTFTMNYTGTGTQYGAVFKPAYSAADTYALAFLASNSTYAAPVFMAGMVHMSGDAGMNLTGTWKYQGSTILTASGQDTTNGFPGLTNYAINIKNSSGGVLSKIASAATAARTWTFPDKTGTVAMTSDIPAQQPQGSNMVSSDQTLSIGDNIVLGAFNLTVPDLTNPVSLSVVSPTNAAAVTASLATQDGWTITTGFAAGTLSVLAPQAFGSPHGWWGKSSMSPPKISTTTNSTSAANVVSSVMVGSVMAMVIDTGHVVIADPVAGTLGARVALPSFVTSSACIPVVFATGPSSFIAFYTDGNVNAYAVAGTVSGTTITLGSVATLSTSALYSDQPLQLSSSTLLFSTINASSQTVLQPLYVSGLTITTGTGVTAINGVNNATANVRYAQASATTALVAAAGLIGTGGYISAQIATVSVSNGTPSLSLGAVVTSSNSFGTGTGIAGPNDALYSFGSGGPFLFTALAYSNSAAFWVMLTVSGTSITFSNAVNTPSYFGSSGVNRQNIPKAYLSASAYANALPVSSSQLVVAVATGSMGTAASALVAFSYSGNTLSVGAVSGTTGSSAVLLSDVATGTKIYARTNNTFYKLSVTGTTISYAFQVAGAPRVIFSDTLTDTTVNYGGTWYAWTGVPAANHAVSATKYVSFTSTSAMDMFGSFA